MQSLSALGSAVGHLLKERRQTLAVAESAAGGLINAALVAVPGASAWYLGGGIIYTGASRSALLGITAQDMANLRSATEPYAKLLAQRVRINLGAAWGLSETGASGPSGNRYGDALGRPTCGPSRAERSNCWNPASSGPDFQFADKGNLPASGIAMMFARRGSA